jgi:hypothetical protein
LDEKIEKQEVELDSNLKFIEEKDDFNLDKLEDLKISNILIDLVSS